MIPIRLLCHLQDISSFIILVLQTEMNFHFVKTGKWLFHLNISKYAFNILVKLCFEISWLFGRVPYDWGKRKFFEVLIV